MQEAESSWTFDIFGFADATTGYSLSLLFCHLVSRAGLVQELGIDEAKLIHYARRIEKGYVSTNPYHNRLVLPDMPKWLAKRKLPPTAYMRNHAMTAGCAGGCLLAGSIPGVQLEMELSW